MIPVGDYVRITVEAISCYHHLGDRRGQVFKVERDHSGYPVVTIAGNDVVLFKHECEHIGFLAALALAAEQAAR